MVEEEKKNNPVPPVYLATQSINNEQGCASKSSQDGVSNFLSPNHVKKVSQNAKRDAKM